MASAKIVAESRMIFKRNRFGQFADECDKAATETVKEMIHRGARTSRTLAPVGKEPWRYNRRHGYVPLKRSIRSRMTSATSGQWYSIAPHALYVELGTSAHRIQGHLKFSWQDGWFYWNNPMFGPVGSGKPYENWDESGAWVRHPGTRAQPFLRPAYDQVVKRQMLEVAREKYPG